MDDKEFLESSEKWDNRELGASMEHAAVASDSEQLSAMLKIVELSNEDESNGNTKSARDLLAERKARK